MEPTSPPTIQESYWQRVVRAWDRFWFTPADPIVLAAIRICTGLVACYALAVLTLDLQEFLGEHAWMDLEIRQHMYRQLPMPVPALDWKGEPQVSPIGRPHWSIWFHVTDPTWMLVIHLGFVAASFLFLIGLATRLTAVLTWFAAMSYIHRAPPVLFGMDTMLTILLLYLMIGPSGAALSVDRLLARWWSRNRSRVLARWQTFWGRAPAPAAAPAAFPETAPPSVSANLAIRLLQIHVCIIYLSAGLAKLKGQQWWEGTAVWGTLANFEYAPMQSEPYLAFLRWLGGNRVLFEVSMTSAALFTLFFEISYPFLVWRPWGRWLILGMAALLHGLIGMFMGLRVFSLLMLAMNLAFVPPEVVHRLLNWLSQKWQALTTKAPEAAPPPAEAAPTERETHVVAGPHGKGKIRKL
jgi:hypothetical protein